MSDTPSGVVISERDTPVDPGRDAGTPAGAFNTPTLGANGQIRGTAGDDRASLATLDIDKDHVINLSAGNDVFVFSNAGGLDTDLNGIVDGGADFDRAFLAGDLSDYIFTIRSDGGIKIQYALDGPGEDGAAVTFRNFEEFTFRGISGSGDAQVNREDNVFTYQELLDAIRAVANPPVEASAFDM